jgi:DNA recombination protein RmuC
MNILIQLVLSILAGIGLGMAATWLSIRKKLLSSDETSIIKERLSTRECDIQKQEIRIQDLLKDVQIKSQQIRDLEVEIAKRDVSIAEMAVRLNNQEVNFKEKLTLLDDAKKQFQTEFQVLATQILDEKSKKFTELNKENIEGVLSPLSKSIDEFKKKVEDVYVHDSEGRAALVNEIDNLKKLNLKIGQDAINLTQALKGGNKTMGRWGELVLERVLEVSGLERGREYETQFHTNSKEGGRYIPDAIIRLPQSKDIIVDSKVSLVAYEAYCSAETDEQRKEALKNHILSVRRHVQNLSEKQYEELPDIRSLDYCLLFIAIEGAFAVALKEDNSLFSEALSKNIIIVCPSTLLATLRTIAFTWRVEKQQRNTQEIAQKAGDLYDKFCSFVSILQDVGENIKKAQEKYDSSMKTLSTGKGNLLKRSEELRLLGVKGKKEISPKLLEQLETDPPKEKSISPAASTKKGVDKE